jgi:hypothetical protein
MVTIAATIKNTYSAVVVWLPMLAPFNGWALQRRHGAQQASSPAREALCPGPRLWYVKLPWDRAMSTNNRLRMAGRRLSSRQIESGEPLRFKTGEVRQDQAGF